jgi:hypothetical protein
MMAVASSNSLAQLLHAVFSHKLRHLAAYWALFPSGPSSLFRARTDKPERLFRSLGRAVRRGQTAATSGALDQEAQ